MKITEVKPIPVGHGARNYLFVKVLLMPYYAYFWLMTVIVFVLVFAVVAFYRIFFYARLRELKI